VGFWFCTTYLFFGILLNILSFEFCKNFTTEEAQYNTSTSVTIMGGGLFCVDMSMLVFYYMTLNRIVAYYSKDYKVNKCLVYFCVHLIALTYTIEMVWSDLFNWGSWFNKIAESYYTKPLGTIKDYSDYFIFSTCMFNANLSTWIQGHIVLAVFNHFG
jgi:hypothetical protein